MADLLEFSEVTTWPQSHNSFYRINSGAIGFEVKAASNAAIGISAKPNNRCEYWILIGERHIWIKRAGNIKEEVELQGPSILSEQEYRRFWANWNCGSVSLGIDRDVTPVISCPTTIKNIEYVTFCNMHESIPAHWRIEIPPTRESLKDISITEGQLRWVPYVTGQNLPEDSLLGGFEDEKLYIARSFHRGSLTPGKFVPSKGKAYISWGDLANEKTTFEVLCGFDCFWVPTVDDKIPVDAFVAGYSERDSERLFLGRTYYEGHLIPGKIHPPYKKLLFSYRGQECGSREYEVLVLLNQNNRRVNPFILFDSSTYVLLPEEPLQSSDEM